MSLLPSGSSAIQDGIFGELQPVAGVGASCICPQPTCVQTLPADLAKTFLEAEFQPVTSA
jgi:hypothetical protein